MTTDPSAPKRKRGRPVVYTYERVKSNYQIPAIVKEKLIQISEKMGLTITETFVKLVQEEYEAKINK